MVAARVAAALGGLLLLHSIYAAAKYRDMLKLTQQEFTALPVPLSAEVAAGAALSLLAAFGLAGPLKPIIMSSGLSMDAGTFRSDFVYFNHRGRALPYNLPASI